MDGRSRIGVSKYYDKTHDSCLLAVSFVCRNSLDSDLEIKRETLLGNCGIRRNGSARTRPDADAMHMRKASGISEVKIAFIIAQKEIMY